MCIRDSFNGLVLDANNELEKTVTLVNNGTSTYVIPTTDADMTEWNATLVKDGVSELVLDTDYFLVDQTIGFASTPLGTVTVTLEFANPIKLEGGDDQTNFIDINGINGIATVDGGNGLQPEYYTLANNGNKNISTDVDLRPLATTIFKVQTNRAGSTVTNESRTFAYIIDMHTNEHIFGMEDAKTSTLSADLNMSDTVLTVADPSKFATAELVLVNNEVIQVQNINNILYIRKRGLNLTFANKHTTGTTITDVTGNAVYYADSPADRRFNDNNTTILDSSSSAEAVMLTGIGKGTIL